MSENIEIKLFDGFMIMKDGKQILENLSNTRKTKLFVAYLLANRDRAISHQELFELLWSGEDYANPATALRTLLYRFRSMIDKEGADALSGAIISRRGTYQWNKNLGISIDSLDFAEMASKGMNESLPVAEREQYLVKAIELYTGSLLPDFCSEPWLISKSAAYRDQYVVAVVEYIDILKERKDYAAIVALCERAQSLAGTSELLELEKQMARLRAASIGTGSENATSDYYNKFKQISKSLQDEVNNIQSELEDDTVDQKAYLCDYNTFREIYHLQRRMQSRSKATIFLGLMDVRVEGVLTDTNSLTNELFDTVITCCQRQLRCGDTICKRNNTQIAVLFPAESYEDAMGVLERLRSAARERVEEELIFVYRVRPLKNARE